MDPTFMGMYCARTGTRGKLFWLHMQATPVLMRTTAALLAMLLCLFTASAKGAQDYPTKTIRLIVPFSPGGGTDLLARLLAKQLAEMYGQQVIVDNRPGAAGTIGSNLVARSASDGHTLLLNVNALAANHTLYQKLPYDTLRDIAPVILVGTTPNVLVVHPSMPAKTAREFVALAKRRPNGIAYASTGTGGSAFLATELFKLPTGVKMIHVPYKGAGPALIGIVSGETQAIAVALPPTIPYIQQRRLRALGITSRRRASTTPEIPTLIEEGIKSMEYDTWYGLFAPAGVPRDIVFKLNADIMTILTSPEFKEQLARRSIEPAGGTPEAFDSYFRTEIEKLGRVIRASGAKPE